MLWNMSDFTSHVQLNELLTGIDVKKGGTMVLSEHRWIIWVLVRHPGSCRSGWKPFGDALQTWRRVVASMPGKFHAFPWEARTSCNVGFIPCASSPSSTGWQRPFRGALQKILAVRCGAYVCQIPFPGKNTTNTRHSANLQTSMASARMTRWAATAMRRRGSYWRPSHTTPNTSPHEPSTFALHRYRTEFQRKNLRA